MKCIRCGTDVKDKETFCAACTKVVSEPLQPSEYLNPQIILPNRKTMPNPPKKQEVKKDRSEGEQKKRASKLPLVLCTLLLTASCILGMLWYWQDQQLQKKDVELQELQNSVDMAQGELEILREENRQLQADAAESKSNYSTLERVPALQLPKEDVQTALDTLLDGQIRGDIGELLLEKLGPLVEKSAFIDRYVAFVENDGSGYYHTYDCADFPAESYWVLNLRLAQEEGYVPCPICHK